MKIFIAFALFIAATSAGFVSQPYVGYNTLGYHQAPLVRTLRPVAYGSPVVGTRVLTPVARQYVSSPVAYGSPVLTAPVAYRSTPVVSRVITPVAVGQGRFIQV